MSPTVEDLLTDALHAARTDPRFHLDPPPDVARRVRRAATAQRRRTTALALTGITVVGGGTAAGVATLRPGPAQLTYGGSPWATGAVPGITPAWTPTSGADWLLSAAAYRRFVATHTTPSPAPHTVQSPAELTDVSARLLAEVRAAVPAGSKLVRQDAPDGLAGAAAVYGTLPDGTPIDVRREPLQGPIDYAQWFTAGVGAGQTPVLAPASKLATGSGYIAAPHTGYAWRDGAGQGAGTVVVVTPGGEATTWNAPLSVPLEQVVGWALAADKFEHTHPDAVDRKPVPTASAGVPTAQPSTGNLTPSPGASSVAPSAAASEAAAKASLELLRAKVAAVVDSITPAAKLSPDTATDAQVILTVGKDHVTVLRLPHQLDAPGARASTLATGSVMWLTTGQGSGFGTGNVVEVNAADGTYTKWFATDGVSLALLQKWATALDSAEHA